MTAGSSRLVGAFVALATPLTRSGEMDGPGLDRLIAHVLERGVDGIVLLGSTGEGYRLDAGTRAAVAERAIERIGGRVPALLAILRPAIGEVWEELERAHVLGASAVLVAPPYFGPLDAAGAAEFYREVARRSKLPVLVYNIPQYSGVILGPRTIADLSREGAIQGIKDSSREMEGFCELLFAVGDRDGFAAFTGTSSLLMSSLVVGACGAITASANVNPQPEVALVRAARAGRWDEARRHHAEVLRLVGALRRGVFPAGVKAALSVLGICGDACAPPTPTLTPAEKDALTHALSELGYVEGASVEGREHIREIGRARRSPSEPRPSPRAPRSSRRTG